MIGQHGSWRPSDTDEAQLRLAVTPAYSALGRLLGLVSGGMLLVASDPSGARFQPHLPALKAQAETARRSVAALPGLTREGALQARFRLCFDRLASVVVWLSEGRPHLCVDDADFVAALRQAARARHVLLDIGWRIGGLHLIDLTCACCRIDHGHVQHVAGEG